MAGAETRLDRVEQRPLSDGVTQVVAAVAV